MTLHSPAPRLLLSLILAASLAFCTLAAPQQIPSAQSDQLFSAGKVLKLKIDLSPDALQSLRREPRKYVKCTLSDGTTTYRNVGIHVKGAAGSTRGIDDKPGLTINMQKFEPGQLFHGMAKFHLANSVQDPSYVSELLCGELFRGAGVPASRVAHALVTIDNRPRGFYYIKEGYDRYFLDRHFKNRTGNFYDGGFLRDVDQPLQLVRSKDQVKNHDDLKALTAATREGDVKKRFEKLDKLLDMERFLRFLALEVITWDWDGYPMNRNNYRIYRDPARNKLVFIPSGMDQMFGDVNGTILPHFQGFVARAVLETPEGRKRYLREMDHIMKKVYRPDDLVKRLDTLEKQIQPALASVDPNAGRDYKHHIERLRQAVRQRAKSVEEQLKRQSK